MNSKNNRGGVIMKAFIKMFTLCCWCILPISLALSAGTVEEKLALEQEQAQQKQIEQEQSGEFDAVLQGSKFTREIPIGTESVKSKEDVELAPIQETQGSSEEDINSKSQLGNHRWKKKSMWIFFAWP